jgi:hypothetical protein
MAAVIDWQGRHYVELSDGLPKLFWRARQEFEVAGHRRTPEIVAHLYVAALVAMRAFTDAGAVTNDEELNSCSLRSAEIFSCLATDKIRRWLRRTRRRCSLRSFGSC